MTVTDLANLERDFEVAEATYRAAVACADHMDVDS